MKSLLINAVEFCLENPLVFDWQQKLCNNYENIREEFSEYLSGPSQKILEIGCSTGACAKVVFDMNKHDYTGVEISQRYVEQASQRVPGAKFVCQDARALSFENDSFDIVFFSGVIHHMDDELITSCLREVRRVLKPTGHLLIAEPVFTPGKYFSNFLLSLDRGRYIRKTEAYKALFNSFSLVRERYFSFSAHRFLSLVWRKS